MVTRVMPRVQEVLIPELRSALPSITFSTWIPDVDKRTFPFVNVRRIGGTAVDVTLFDLASLEIAAFSRDGLIDAEEIYLDVRQVVWDLVGDQTVTGAGYLHSFRETIGPTNFDSPFDDSWRVQGVIQVGLRPNRT